MLVELARIVPDGIICFFTSYSHLELFLCEWDEHGVLRDLFNYKLLFIESRDVNESNLAVYNYKKACDEGKGAVLLCVVRGHISEGVHFNDHYGRCCVLMGVPFLLVYYVCVIHRNSQSKELKIKLEYLRNEYDIDENEYYVYDAIRQVVCVWMEMIYRARSAWEERFETRTIIPSSYSRINGTTALTIVGSCRCG